MAEARGPLGWISRAATLMRRPVTARDFLAARASGRLDVEDDFLARLQLRSGVFKTTRRGRFDETLPFLMSLIPSGTSKLRVLDVACSSGVATVELHRALRERAIEAETFGTDILIRATLAVFPDGASVLLDSQGEILQAEVGGVTVTRHPTRGERLLRPLHVARAQRLIRRLAAPMRAGTPPRGTRFVDVPLTSSATEGCPGLQIAQESILTPRIGGEFGLIRAANILNLDYFSRADLKELASALLARLAPGGLFFVLRTVGSVNHGTLWMREAQGLREVGRCGAGSEVGDVVREAAGPTAA